MIIRRLSRTEFATALRHGRGLAAMHVMACGLDGIDDLVLEACLDNLAYDAQCEDGRAPWLYNMFKGSAQYSHYAEAILAMLNNDIEHRSMEQFCNLAGLMACDGDSNAAQALRSFVWAQDFSLFPPLGCPAIVMLDGIPAIAELARRLGRVVMQDADATIFSLDDVTEGLDCHDDALTTLKQLAVDDPAIAAYLQISLQLDADDDIDRDKSSVMRQVRERARATYPIEKILAAAESGTIPGFSSSVFSSYRTFGRWANQNELEIILQRLVAATAPEVCLRLLWVFKKVAPPSLHPRIWALVENSDERVRHAALTALSHVSDESVGNYGRGRLRAGIPASDSEVIELFINNYRDGDEKLILSALNALQAQSLSDDELHGLGSRVLDVCKANKFPVLAQLAEWVYLTNPCSICRNAAVKWLIDVAVLPAEIANECLYDTDRDTEKLARKIVMASQQHNSISAH